MGEVFFFVLIYCSKYYPCYLYTLNKLNLKYSILTELYRFTFTFPFSSGHLYASIWFLFIIFHIYFFFGHNDLYKSCRVGDYIFRNMKSMDHAWFWTSVRCQMNCKNQSYPWDLSQILDPSVENFYKHKLLYTKFCRKSDLLLMLH